MAYGVFYCRQAQPEAWLQSQVQLGNEAMAEKTAGREWT
jgi:hypothetical protein